MNKNNIKKEASFEFKCSEDKKSVELKSYVTGKSAFIPCGENAECIEGIGCRNIAQIVKQAPTNNYSAFGAMALILLIILWRRS